MKSIRTISFIIYILLIVLTGCQQNNDSYNEVEREGNNIVDNGLTYRDKKFNFSVKYPENWTSEIHEWREGTDEQEASPDAGIRIYVDEKQEGFIYVFGQVSTLSVPIEESAEEIFETTSNISGKLYTKNVEGIKIINLILDEQQLSLKSYNGRSLGATVRMNLDYFNLNKEKVMDVLRSIEVYKNGN